MDHKVVKIYDKIIRSYMDMEDKPQFVVDRFMECLFSEKHCKEKNVAMRRIFFEALDKYPLNEVD